jgi:hypothetical protein
MFLVYVQIMGKAANASGRQLVRQKSNDKRFSLECWPNV